MRELLERWRSLEPERCGISEHAAHLGKPFAFRIPWPMLDADPVNRAVLLAAVIEAIEARGWEWTIWSDGREREATVHIQDADPKQPRRNYGTGLTTMPTAAALVTAYVAALEAEASQ